MNFNFKVFTKAFAQSLNKSLASKSLVQKFSFMNNLQLPNLQQTVTNTILIINISNSNNINKFWVGIFTGQGHINQVY